MTEPKPVSAYERLKALLPEEQIHDLCDAIEFVKAFGFGSVEIEIKREPFRVHYHMAKDLTGARIRGRERLRPEPILQNLKADI